MQLRVRGPSEYMFLGVILVHIKHSVYIPAYGKNCPAQVFYAEVIMKVVLDLEITEIPETNTGSAALSYHLFTLVPLIPNMSTTEFSLCIITHNDRGDIREGNKI
jgi:hypothetical protein